jgi:hypothetical protein
LSERASSYEVKFTDDAWQDVRGFVVVCAVGPRKADDIEDVYKQLTKIAESGRLAEQVKVVLEIILPGRKK